MSETNLAEAPLANAPEARTADGTLVNQAAKPTEESTQSTPSTKTETGQAASTEASKPADGKSLTNTETAKAAPAGAPEKYEPFKAPEGYEVDADAFAKATPVFKELGLSQDQAQKLIDLYADASLKAANEPYKLYENLRNDWRDKVIKDPTLGDGTGLRNEVKATIGRAIDSLPSDVARDFREAMDLTGAGDNPAFVKAFYNLAQRVTEGTSVKGGAPSPFGQRNPSEGPKSAATALYPNLPSSAT